MNIDRRSLEEDLLRFVAKRKQKLRECGKNRQSAEAIGRMAIHRKKNSKVLQVEMVCFKEEARGNGEKGAKVYH